MHVLLWMQMWCETVSFIIHEMFVEHNDTQTNYEWNRERNPEGVQSHAMWEPMPSYSKDKMGLMPIVFCVTG